jgi:transcription initiation factor TFIIE subunit beta
LSTVETNETGGAPLTGTSTGAPIDTGVGRHLHTQVLYAVGYLKEHPNNPIRLEELAAFSGVSELQHNSELLAAFRAHDKVNYDEKLDLYSFKVLLLPIIYIIIYTSTAADARPAWRFPFLQPDFAIRNNSELLALLRRYSPRGGMMVKKLQESWPNARQAIEELEAEGKVLVIRTGTTEKEGFMKMVFWNEIGDMPQIDQGGWSNLMATCCTSRADCFPRLLRDECAEFKDMWHGLKLPDAIQIAKELEEGTLVSCSMFHLSCHRSPMFCLLQKAE